MRAFEFIWENTVHDSDGAPIDMAELAAEVFEYLFDVPNVIDPVISTEGNGLLIQMEVRSVDIGSVVVDGMAAVRGALRAVGCALDGDDPTLVASKEEFVFLGAGGGKVSQRAYTRELVDG